MICRTAVEAISAVDPRIIEYIKRQAIAEYEAGQKGDLLYKEQEVTFSDVKRGDLENAATVGESTDDSARFQKTCIYGKREPEHNTIFVDLWNRVETRAQGRLIDDTGLP